MIRIFFNSQFLSNGIKRFIPSRKSLDLHSY